MIEPAEFFKQLAEDTTARLRVRSALNPLLWMCAIVSPVCFASATRFSGTQSDVLIATGVIPILVCCAVAGYFAKTRPEKLQSEDYQIRKQALELIQKKGERFSIESASVEAITNPQLPALTDESDEAEK